MTVLIENDSGRVAPPTTLRSSINGVTAGEVPVDEMAPGEQRSFVVLVDSAGLPDPSNIALTVDPEDVISELSETDNRWETSVEVIPPPTQAELLVQPGSVSPVTVTSFPAQVNVSAVIANVGFQPASPLSIEIQASYSDGSNAVIDQQTMIVGEQSSSSFAASIVLERRPASLSIVLDPEDSIPEADEANNVAEIPLSVVDGANLTADAVIVDGAVVDTPATVRWSVTNTGTINITNASLVVEVESPTSVTVILLDQTVDLAAGESVDFELPWIPNEPGDHSLLAQVDSANVIAEVDEGDNAFSDTITVTASVQPNLLISGGSFAIAPDPPLAGRPLEVSVDVANTGVATGAFSVTVGVGATVDQLLTEQSVVVGAGVDEQSTQTVDIALPALEAGETRIFVIVDSEDDIAESIETDNVAFREISVRSLPDLTVPLQSLNLVPSLPVPGETVGLDFAVANGGGQASAVTDVRVYSGADNGERSLIETVSLDVLEPQSSATFSISWTLDETTEYVEVEVDEAGLVAESEEGNNVTRQPLIAASRDLYSTERYISPNGDGVQDITTIGFSREDAGDFTMDIRDEFGRQVLSRAFGQVNSGQFTWDGRTRFGRVARDGLYSVSLRSGDSLLGSVALTVDTNRQSLYRAAEADQLLRFDLECEANETVRAYSLSGEHAYLFGPGGLVRKDARGGRRSVLVNASWFSISGISSPELHPVADGRVVITDYREMLWITTGPGGQPAALQHTPGELLHARQNALVVVNNASTEIVSLNPQVPPVVLPRISGEFVGTTPHGDVFLDVDYDDDAAIVYLLGNGPVPQVYSQMFEGEEVRLEMGTGGRMALVSTPDQRLVPDGLPVRVHGLQTTDSGITSYFLHERSVPDAWDVSVVYTPAGDVVIVYGFENRAIWVDATGAVVRDDVLVPSDQAPASVTAIMDQARLLTTSMPNSPHAMRVIEDEYRAILALSVGDYDTIDPTRKSAKGGYSYRQELQRYLDATFFFSLDLTTATPTYLGAFAPYALDLPNAIDEEPRAEIPPWVAGTNGFSGEYDGLSRFSSDSLAIVGEHGGFEREFMRPRARSVPTLRTLHRFDCMGVESSDNLIANFEIEPYPSLVEFVGTVTDAELADYTFSYRRVGEDGWTQLPSVGFEPVIDGYLGSWSAPSAGTFEVRLRARDRAGNVVDAVNAVTFATPGNVTEVAVAPSEFSPNGDGVQDQVIVDYRVVSPFTGQVRVEDRFGQIVWQRPVQHPTIPQVSQQLVWDGRTTNGAVQPDGRYVLEFEGRHAPLVLDRTAPVVSGEFISAYAPVDGKVNVKYGLVGSVDEAFRLQSTVLQFADPSYPEVELSVKDQQWSTIVGHDAFVDGWVELRATDGAGNRSVMQFTRHFDEWIIDYVAVGGYSERMPASIGPTRNSDFPNIADTIVNETGATTVYFRSFLLADLVGEPLAQISDQDGDNEILVPVTRLTRAESESAGIPDRYGMQVFAVDIADIPWQTFQVRLHGVDAEGPLYSNGIEIAQPGSVSVLSIDEELDPVDQRRPAQTLFKQFIAEEFDDAGPHVFAFVTAQGAFEFSESTLQLWDASGDRYSGIAAFSPVANESYVTLDGSQYFAQLFAIPADLCGEYFAGWTGQIVGIDGSIRPSDETALNPSSPELGARLTAACAWLDADQVTMEGETCDNTVDPLMHLAVDVIFEGTVEAVNVYRIDNDGHHVLVDNRLLPSFTTAPGSRRTLDPPFSFSKSANSGDYAVELVLPGGERVFDELFMIADRSRPSVSIYEPAPGASVCATGEDGLRMVPLYGSVSDDFGFVIDAWIINSGDPLPLCDLATCESEAKERPPLTGLIAEPVVSSVIGTHQSVSAIVQVRDLSGARQCAIRDFSLDAAVDASVTFLGTRREQLWTEDGIVERGVFSPNSDGIHDMARYRVEPMEPVSITATVYPTRVDGGLRAPDLTSPLSQLADNLSTESAVDILWDGNGAADDVYAVVILIEDNCGFVREFLEFIEVDTTGPDVQIDYPLPGDALGASVSVTGSSVDRNFLEGALIVIDGAGDEFVLRRWDDVRNSELLATWNVTAFEQGTYVLRLEALDIVGNSSVFESVVDYSEVADLFWTAEISADAFSPNGDGTQDTVSMTLGLTSGVGMLDVVVIDTVGTTVRTLVSDSDVDEGAISVVWDGAGDASVTLPDGPYFVDIAVTQSGTGYVESLQFSVVLDTQAPELVLENPTGAFAPQSGSVVLSATDDRLVSVQAWHSQSAGTAMVLDATTAGRYTLFGLDGLAGFQRVEATAVDRAGNSAMGAWEFTIDATPPTVVLASPLDAAVLRHTSVPVVAEASDQRLSELSVFLTNPDGSGPIILGSASADAGSAYLDTQWSVNVPDGDYAVEAIAFDEAGNSASARAMITVDATAPVVAIAQPVSGSLINGPMDIVGEVYDERLTEYRVQISAAPFAIYSDVYVGAENVVAGGVLGPLVLPSADGTYRLRVRAVDEAGNVNESAPVEFSIDREPPPRVLDLVGERHPPWDFSLQWSTAGQPDDVDYSVRRNGVEIARTASAAHLDVDVPEGTHRYVVVAVDSAGNAGEPSNGVEFAVDRTPPVVSLHSPTAGETVRATVDIFATVSADDDLDQWTLSAGPSGGGLVELRSGIDEYAHESLFLLDTEGLGNTGSFDIRLHAVDRTGNDAEAIVTVSVDNLAPAAPTGVTAILQGGQDALVTWNPNIETDLRGYVVYRNDVSIAGDADPLAATSFIDTDIPDGSMSYSVRAVDEAGNISAPGGPADVHRESGAPDVVIVAPAPGTRFDSPITVRAVSEDQDIATVDLEWALSSGGPFAPFATVSQAPFSSVFDPSVHLSDLGTVYLRAAATDATGNTGLADIVAVEYADVTAPLRPTDVTGRVDGNTVFIEWDHAEPADVVHYRVERQRDGNSSWVEIPASPATGLTVTDAGLDDGRYTYRVSAIDEADNDSEALESLALPILSVFLALPDTPTADPTVLLAGQSPVAGELTIEIVNGAQPPQVVMLEIAAGEDFETSGSLGQGENSITGVLHYGGVHRSRPATLEVLLGSVPGTPANLVATPNTDSVNLEWDALVLPPAGYRMYRNAAPASGDVAAALTVDASSNPQLVSRIVDGNPQTYWQPSAADIAAGEPAVAFSLVETSLVSSVQVDFSGGDVYRYTVDYWDGAQWRGFQQSFTEDVLIDTRSIWTDQLRIRIEDYFPYNPRIRLAEVRVMVRPIVASPAFIDTPPASGEFSYQVSAVSELGFEGALSSPAEAAFGDFTPPSAVVLSGAVNGNEVALSWTQPPEPDVESYRVYRDGQALGIVSVPGTEFVDAGLANGIYQYVVRAVDATGNASPDSNAYSAEVALPLPSPRNLTATLEESAQTVMLTWEGDPEILRYTVLRAVEGESLRPLATTTGLSHDDREIAPGITYIYTITGELLDGSAAGVSNSVTVSIPAAFGGAAPEIVLPAPGGQTITLNDSVVDISGIAQPFSDVELFRDNVHIDTTPVVQGWYVLESDLAAGSISRPRLSPVADVFVDGGNEIVDLASGDRSPLPIAGRDVSWSADGERVYIATGQAAFVFDTVSEDLTQIAAYSGLNLIEISPDETRAVVLTLAPFVGYRYGMLDLATGTLTDLQINGYQYADNDYVAWSPAGDRIAIVQRINSVRNDLWIVEPDNNVRFALGVSAWPGMQWRADGDLLAIPVRENYGYQPVVVWDALFGGISELEPARRVAWRPDGQMLATETSGYLQFWEMPTFDPVGDAILPIHPEALSWRASGSLMAMGDYVLATVAEGGFFTFTDAALDVGTNRFAARSIALDGEPSEFSETLWVLRDVGSRPDVQIDSLFMIPESGESGETFDARFTISNSGTALAPQHIARIVITQPDGASLAMNTQVPALAAGQTVPVQQPLGALTDAGIYRVHVTADAANVLAEENETNNQAFVSFLVAEAGSGPELTLDVGASVYPYGVPLAGSVRVYQPAAAQEANLEVWLATPSGARLETIASASLIVEPGLNPPIPISLDLSGYLAGSYHVEARLYAMSGEELDRASQPIEISDFIQAGLTLAVPDSVMRGSLITADATVDYSAGNVILQGATLDWSLQDDLGTALEQRSDPLPSLQPGDTGAVGESFDSSGLTAGLYTVAVQLRRSGEILAAAERMVDITEAGVSTSLSGRLAVPARLPVHQAVDAAYSITGSPNLGDVELEIRLLRGSDLNLLARVTDVVSIGSTGLVDGAVNLLDAGHRVGTYVLELWISPIGDSLRLEERATLSLVDVRPPVVSMTAPVAAQVVQPLSEMRVRAVDADSRVDSVFIAVDGGVFSRASLSAATGLYVARVADSEEGSHVIDALATDIYGNESGTTRTAYIVDATAPVITFMGVADGDLVNTPVTPVISVTDAHPGSQSVTLNGVSFASGTTVGDEAVYVLNVAATDAAGNRSEGQITFEIDLTPPLVTVDGPISGAVVPDATVDVFGTTEPSAAVALSGPTGAAGVVADAVGNFRFENVALSIGINALSVSATDLAGNASAPVIVEITRQDVAGELNASIENLPLSVGMNEDVTLQVRLTNSTAGSLTDAPYTVTLADVDSNAVDTVAGAVSLGGFEDTVIDIVLSSVGSEPGEHFVFVTSAETLLASDTLSILDTLAPVITVTAPTQDLVSGPSVLVSGTVVDTHSVVENSQVIIDGVSQALPLSGGAFSELLTLGHGAHTLQVTAADTAGNIGQSVQVSFEVDAQAPAIVIEGVEDAGLYNNAVTPTVMINDDHLTTSEILLNGLDFVSGTVVAADGAYELFVRAEDAVANSTAVALTFTVDTQPPALVVTSPPTGMTVTQDRINIVGESEEGALVRLASPSLMTIADANGAFLFADVPLNEGENAFSTTAEDAAGNISAPVTVSVLRIDPGNLTGSISTAPSLGIGEDLVVDLVLSNSGTIAMQSIDVRASVVGAGLNGTHGPDSVASIPAGDSHVIPVTWPTSQAQPGTATMSLEALSPANGLPQWTAIATVTVSLTDSQAPTVEIQSPDDGAFVPLGFRVDASAVDEHGKVGVVEMRIDDGPWTAMAPQADDVFIAYPQGVSYGQHGLEVRATDQADNTGLSQSHAFFFDDRAPIVDVSGIDEAGLYNNAVTVIVAISDDHLDDKRTAITLNGQPFESGQSVSVDGSYVLEARAFDLAGNETAVTRSFAIDTVAPTLSLVSPADGSTLDSASVAIQLAADDASIVDFLQDGNDVLRLPVGDDGQLIIPVTLMAGSNAFSATAEDAAGNRSAPLGFSLILDSGAPVTARFVDDLEGWSAEEILQRSVLIENRTDTPLLSASLRLDAVSLGTVVGSVIVTADLMPDVPQEVLFALATDEWPVTDIETRVWIQATEVNSGQWTQLAADILPGNVNPLTIEITYPVNDTIIRSDYTQILGTTRAGVDLSLEGPFGFASTTTAGPSGEFTFAGVPVPSGRHQYTVTASDGGETATASIELRGQALRVPAISPWAVLVLIVTMVLIGRGRLHREERA